MRLYLQFGHGMMELSRELLSEWENSGVVLSPRDLSEDQLQRTAQNARDEGAEPLLDPQCYLRDANHHRLTSYAYWQTYRSHSTISLLSGQGSRRLLRELGELVRRLEIERHILPGILAEAVDSNWLALQEQLIEAGEQEFGAAPLIATVALSSDSARHEEQVEAIVERAADWPVAGFYLAIEPPGGYLVEDPVWLSNILILASGLKLLGREVIVGYGNHQMLALAAANADVLAAGTWMNVRTFDRDRLYNQPNVPMQRGIWFYCPQTLTEYQPVFLDMAQRRGMLNDMRPDPRLGSSYADPLFAGPQPSTVQWGEPVAFRHYLACVRGQCADLTASSFAEALDKQRRLLDSAEMLHQRLTRGGVFSRGRDFGPIFNINRSALADLEHARGARLRREWP